MFKLWCEQGISFETRRSHIIETRPDLSCRVNVSYPLISVHVITVKDACCDWFKCNQIKLIKVQQGWWMKQLCTKSIIATSLLVPTAFSHQSDIFLERCIFLLAIFCWCKSIFDTLRDKWAMEVQKHSQCFPKLKFLKRIWSLDSLISLIRKCF